MTGTALKPRRRPSCPQVVLQAVLGLLFLLAALLWFTDPAHRSAGPSRIDWPALAKN